MRKDLNVIVAFMSKCVCVGVCVREGKIERDGEVRCGFQVWFHIMCPSGTVCIPGLPALFIPDSFVLVLSLTLCTIPHILLAHQVFPAHAQAKAVKLLMYLFNRMAAGLYVVSGNSTPLIHF